MSDYEAGQSKIYTQEIFLPYWFLYECLGAGFVLNLHFQSSVSYFILGYLRENCQILRQSGKYGLRLGIGQAVFAATVLYSQRHGQHTNDSFREKRQQREPEENWIIARNTHEPIVSKEIFEKAQQNGQGSFQLRRIFFKEKVFFTGAAVSHGTCPQPCDDGCI